MGGLGWGEECFLETERTLLWRDPSREPEDQLGNSGHK